MLFAGQVDELHGIATDTDGEVLVLLLLRVLHGILEFLYTEDVDVEVVCALVEIAVHDADEGLGTLFVVVPQRIRVDGLRVGDAVQRILVGQLCHGVERGQQAVLLCPV